MRLIDADKFLDKLDDEIEMGISDIVEAVNNALGKTPTEDVKPVIHAHWDDTFDGITPYCTNCGRTHKCLNRVPDYCPNCGAEMDEEAKE